MSSPPRDRVTAERLDAGDPPVRDDARIYREVLRLRETGERGALATVIGVEGSTPARATMKILVRDDGTTLGTVGGGCLEEEVKRLARDVIDQEQTARFAMRLDGSEADGALICGGSVEVFLEPIGAPALLLFGGGHVGRAVAELAVRAGFRLTVTDDRPDYAQPDRFPMAAETVVEYPDRAAQTLPVDRATFVLVMTRSHDDDRDILRALFERGAEPRYLGMIGSVTKVRRTFEQLVSQGVARDWLRRVRAPVGFAIGARTATEIAVSVVAELVARRRGKDQGRWDLARGIDADAEPKAP